MNILPKEVFLLFRSCTELRFGWDDLFDSYHHQEIENFCFYWMAFRSSIMRKGHFLCVYLFLPIQNSAKLYNVVYILKTHEYACTLAEKQNWERSLFKIYEIKLILYYIEQWIRLSLSMQKILAFWLSMCYLSPSDLRSRTT